jgi:hypothetical protein
MNEYRLLTKDMESINTVRCDSFEEAIAYFAEKKRLSTTDLMTIFKVDILPADPVGGTSRR